MLMCTPRSTNSRINATPSETGPKYGEITNMCCCAERIRVLMSLAIVTSSSGETSLAILPGRSANTVAGTHVNCKSSASSSCASQVASPAATTSSSACGTTSACTGAATDAMGYAYLLFQNASNEADN